MRFSPADTFDRYVIEALLGQGGMGEVYRAEDTRLRRKVALKVLRAGEAWDRETWRRAVVRMQREARAVAALSHPNIVGIYDVGEYDGTPFIAMEFVKGESLRAFIGQNKPIGVVLGILLDMAKALSAAHQAGIIHRDIKPENVMVRGDGAVKVLDFGIARMAPQEADPRAPAKEGALVTMTTLGEVVGTPAYMSPEQLSAAELDARTDQFAFGIVAYELVSGRLPFPADKGPMSLIASILTADPEPLEGGPDGLRAVIARTLEKSPEERFASMDDVATELRALVALEEVKSTDPGRVLAAITKSNERPATLAETKTTEPDPASAAIMKSDERPATREVTREVTPEVTPDATPDPAHESTSITKSGERPVTLEKAPDAMQEKVPAATQAATQDPLISKGRWALPVAVVSALALGVGLVATSKKSGSEASPQLASASASAQASPSPVAVTDLPIPASQSAEAKLAFREGLQATRDAMWETATASFDRARKADPGMVAAHVRYAMLGYGFDKLASREAYQKAVLLRMDLSERDAGLLDALEPIIQSEPSDYDTARRRFEALSARYPKDAELAFWYARATFYRGKGQAAEMERVIALTDRCVELDARYADCWQTKEWALSALLRYDEALAVLDKCVEVAPNAVDCLTDKIKVNVKLGRCPAVIETARRWTAKEPASPAPYKLLSTALYSTGEPQSEVRAALDQAEKRFVAKGQREEAEELDGLRGLMSGDLVAAKRVFDGAASKVSPDALGREADYHFQRAALRMELGQLDEAAKVADEFFVRSAANLSRDPDTKNDPTIFFHAVRLRAGKETRAQYEAARAKWLDDKKAHWDVFSTWVYGYVMPAFSGEMAEEALAKEAELAPVPAGGAEAMNPAAAAARGRIRFLAGKVKEASPFLERGARACDALEMPMWYVRNFADLGAVREAAGDNPGACSAYQAVLSRWGSAKESVTVKDVKKRASALGCGGSSG